VPVWFLNRLIAREARESVALLVQRARTRVRLRRWDQAIADYEHAARLTPDDASVLLEVARFCVQQQQPDRAADYFAKAAVAGGEDADLWVETAGELVRLQRWDKATEHYLRAIDLQPDDHGVGSARSMTCRELARSPQVFDRAFWLRPRDPNLLTGRARAHVERGEWKEAATDFARAIELAGVDERSYEYAAVLLILDDEAGYHQVVARMVEQIGDTRDPFLAYVLARTCSLVPKSAVDPARAVAWAEQAVADRPKAGWYVHGLGLALYRKGDYEGAVARLTESEKLEWEPTLNWLLLAMAHRRLGHAEEARKYLNRATDYLDRRPPMKPFTAVMLSTDAEEAQLLHREANELIHGKKKSR
jgi:tetratricopeptide (TPR) repeat protein